MHVYVHVYVYVYVDVYMQFLTFLLKLFADASYCILSIHLLCYRNVQFIVVCVGESKVYCMYNVYEHAHIP